MSRPVTYRILPRPDGRYDVDVAIRHGKRFRRRGLASQAAAEASVIELGAIMAGCGAALAREGSAEAACLADMAGPLAQ